MQSGQGRGRRLLAFSSSSREMRMMQQILKHGQLASDIVAGGLVAGLATVGRLKASDHQDTPEVELSPRYDVNDVYVFPAATAGRVALRLGPALPAPPPRTPALT